MPGVPSPPPSDAPPSDAPPSDAPPSDAPPSAAPPSAAPPSAAPPSSADPCLDLRQSARSGDISSLRAHLTSPVLSALDSRDSLSGNTALHYAAANGHDAVVDALLSAGATPDVRNGAGGTPLHYAAAGRAVACARRLVAGGADIFAVNAAGATAMDDALTVGGGASGEVATFLKEESDRREPAGIPEDLVDGEELVAGSG